MVPIENRSISTKLTHCSHSDHACIYYPINHLTLTKKLYSLKMQDDTHAYSQGHHRSARHVYPNLFFIVSPFNCISYIIRERCGVELHDSKVSPLKTGAHTVLTTLTRLPTLPGTTRRLLLSGMKYLSVLEYEGVNGTTGI